MNSTSKNFPTKYLKAYIYTYPTIGKTIRSSFWNVVYTMSSMEALACGNRYGPWTHDELLLLQNATHLFNSHQFLNHYNYDQCLHDINKASYTVINHGAFDHISWNYDHGFWVSLRFEIIRRRIFLSKKKPPPQKKRQIKGKTYQILVF